MNRRLRLLVALALGGLTIGSLGFGEQAASAEGVAHGSAHGAPALAGAADSRQPAASPSGGLRGRVAALGARHGTCLSAVLVGTPAAPLATGASFASTTAGPGGRFRLSGLRPGAYEVTAAPCGGGARAAAGATVVRARVVPGVTMPVHMAVLGSPGVAAATSGTAVISGHVSGPGGSPIRGVCVAATSGSARRMTESRSGGRFSIRRLAAGTYTLSADPCSTRRDVAPVVVSTPVTVTRGESAPPVTVTLPRGAGLAGTVAAPSGRPLGGICVGLSPNVSPTVSAADIALVAAFAPPWLSPVATRSDGEFSIDQLPAWDVVVSDAAGCGNGGNWVTEYSPDELYSWLGAPVVLRPGATEREDATLERGGSLAGRVLVRHGSSALVHRLCVVAGPDTGIGRPFVTLDGRRVVSGGYFSTMVTRSGRFDLRRLPPGAYSVLVAPTCAIGRSAVALAYAGGGAGPPGELLSVGPGQRVGRLRLVTSLAATASGVVAEKGSPAASTEVCLTFERPRTAAPVLSAAVDTSARGRYRLGAIPAGRFIVEAKACLGGRYGPRWSGRAARPSLAETVSFRPGAGVRGLDFDLPPAAVISGEVTIPNGHPIREACVEAVAPGETAFDATNKEGRYRLTGLGTGHVLLEASRCYSITEYSGVTRAGVRTTEGASTEGVNLSLVVGARIGGIVTTRTGRPLGGECLVTSTPPGTVAPTAITQQNGTYELFGVPPGHVAVHVLPSCSATIGYGPKVVTRRDVAAGGFYNAGDAKLSLDGSISGAATIADGGAAATALRGECVTAVPVGRAASGRPEERAATSAHGTYSLEQLQPGRYDVEFSAGCGAAHTVEQWWDGASSQSAATPVSVKNGRDRRDVDATVTRS